MCLNLGKDAETGCEQRSQVLNVTLLPSLFIYHQTRHSLFTQPQQVACQENVCFKHFISVEDSYIYIWQYIKSYTNALSVCSKSA